MIAGVSERNGIRGRSDSDDAWKVTIGLAKFFTLFLLAVDLLYGKIYEETLYDEALLGLMTAPDIVDIDDVKGEDGPVYETLIYVLIGMGHIHLVNPK